MNLNSSVENDTSSNPKRERQPVFFLLSAFSLVMIVMCTLQFMGRFNYQQGSNAINSGEIKEAEDYFQKAESFSLPFVFIRDQVLLNIGLGDLNVLKAESAKKVVVYSDSMEQADRFYRIAIDKDPHNLDAYTGLVRATIGLENVYPFLHKKEYPHKVLPLFEQLRSLMPANLYTHSLLTKYYHRKNMTDELRTVIGEAVSHYPPIYFQLLKQPFYSLAMNEMLKTSLHSAIDHDIYAHRAYTALSNIYEREGDLSKAIDSYLQAIPPAAPKKDISSYFVRLGHLYLKNLQVDEAKSAFLTSMKTKDRDKRLQQIWNYYNREKRYPEFIQLITDAEKKYSLTDYVRILRALCLMKTEQYQMAISNLIRIDSAKHLPESYYLQSQIAEKLGDWDTMELRSQRATVLNPMIAKYHYQFSKALYKQKKYPQAEIAVTEAIDLSEKVSPWHLSYRAWTRYHQGKDQLAREDWERAIKISPNTASFYMNMVHVYEKGGNFESALDYVQKALKLKPDEQSFMDALHRLETKVEAQ